MRTPVLLCGLLSSLAATTTTARADDNDVAPTAAPPMATAPAPGPMAYEPEAAERYDRARFSGGRLVGEILLGALGGTVAAIGVYKGVGGLGGAIGGAFAGFVVTPLVEWGVGSALGGEGTLKAAYYGGIIGLTVTAPTAPGGELLVLAIAQILCPITSGLFFEVSSNMHAREWQMQHGLSVAVAPHAGAGGSVDGAALTAALRW